MSNFNLDTIENGDVEDIKKIDGRDPRDLELEQLTSLLLMERLRQLQDQSECEFKELKKRQEEVVKMHKLLKIINTHTNSDTQLTFERDSEIHKLLEEARKELGIDLQIANPDKKGKITCSRDQRERLIDNIRMSIDDHNTKNEMQMQTVTRLINERYESYQMARAILKPLHEDKMSKARAIAGR